MADSKTGSDGSDRDLALRVGKKIAMFRARSQLSQGELAQRIGIRQGPLSNLENGKNLPSAKVLMRLRQVLQVSIDQILDIEGSAFGAGLGHDFVGRMAVVYANKDIEQSELRDRLALAMSSYNELEDLCSAHTISQNPMMAPFDLTNDAVERVAVRLRTSFGIENAFYLNVAELLESYGYKIIILELGPNVPLAVYYDEVKRVPFIFLSSKLNSEEQNYHAAYALSRIVLFLRDLDCREKPHTQEVLKDRLAKGLTMAFLMPAELINRYVLQLGLSPDQWDFELLLRVKALFGVSTDVMIRRLERLCLISEHSASRFDEALHKAVREGYTESSRSRLCQRVNLRLSNLLYCGRLLNPEATKVLAERFKEAAVDV